jgi:uncharacterized repeat protein (TIGR03833 family)
VITKWRNRCDIIWGIGAEYQSDTKTRRKMNGQNRIDVKIGATVKIVLKSDQRTGKLTEGVVGRILTNSSFHPHGIKVMLTNGQVGRVQEIL